MRILIVKLSSLGDVAHTLPVVADIRAAHPDARVDWVVEPAFAGLVRRVDGIGDVIDAPLRRWRDNWWRAKTRSEWRAFKERLRREPYDAVIDLQGLTKSALVARLARGRSYGIANRTEGSSHEAPARWLVDLAIQLPPRVHALDRARQLVARVLGTQVQGPPDFGLRSSAAKLAQPTVVFVHGSSREDKLWPEARWVALGRRFTDAGWHVALPHGDEFEQVRAERLAAAIDVDITAFGESRSSVGPVVQVWPRLGLDALVDRLGAVHGVVGAGGELGSLAGALELPRVSLAGAPSVDDVWRACQPLLGARRVSRA